MDMITVSAKTLDEAITKALIELQTTSEHLHYEVIEKGSSGLFGIFGAKPCVIRAKVMSEEEEKAVKKAAADKAKAEKEAARAAAKAAEEKAKAEAKAAAEKAKAEEMAKVAAAKAAQKPVEKPVEKSIEKPVEKSSEKTPQKAAEKNIKKNTPEKKEAKAEKTPLKVDEAAVQTKAKEFLTQVFGAMDMTVEISTTFDTAEGELQVMMSGADMGILIGKRGQTLDSLQYLVSLVVNKETEGYLRVKLDTENYRERRKETLETLAKNISYKVKRTKRPVSLEPMNPYERRIIHSALQNDKYVVTRSEGEDPYRHVVISLKRESYGNGKKDRYQPRNKDRNPENKAVENKSENKVEHAAE